MRKVRFSSRVASIHRLSTKIARAVGTWHTTMPHFDPLLFINGVCWHAVGWTAVVVRSQLWPTLARTHYYGAGKLPVG